MNMKKTIIALILLSFIIGNTSAQDDSPNKRLKSGFWLKLGYDAPMANFLYLKGATIGDRNADYGANFQLGTTFYIGKRIGNKLRFGLDAGWLDVSYIGLNSRVGSDGMNFFINLLEVGPIISFSPNKSIAFDLYGRVVPSFSLMYYNTTILGTYQDEGYTGFSTNGLIGASFRAKVFLVGIEYNFGGMKYASVDDTEYGDLPKLKINNIRLLLGFKF
jgi:hypothetical protein